jgi:plastocyanin
MRFPRVVLGTTCLALTLALAACGGAAPSAAPQAPGNAFTVKGTDAMKFEPARLTVKAGQPVELTFQNAGAIVHNITIKTGAEQPVRLVVPAGKTEKTTVTFAKPGTFEFACDEAGHTEAGMKGAIVVQ